MDFITGTILSGVIYDMLKHQVGVSAGNIKERLQNWAVDEAVAKAMEKELSKLNLSDELSEVAIQRKIESSVEITVLIAAIKPSLNTSIVQNHNGTGDNVAGDKNING